MKKHSFYLIFLSTLIFTITSLAAPRLLSYKGVLLDNIGEPINGTVSMTFRIYGVPSGGAALWSEAQNVQVSNGMFNVVLGEIQQLPSLLFQNDSLYIGVQIGIDAEMTPRKQMTSEGYVFDAIE